MLGRCSDRQPFRTEGYATFLCTEEGPLGGHAGMTLTCNDLPDANLEGQGPAALIAGVNDGIVGRQPALVVAPARISRIDACLCCPRQVM